MLHDFDKLRCFWMKPAGAGKLGGLELIVGPDCLQGSQLHATCDAATVVPPGVRSNTFHMASAALPPGGLPGGPCLRDFQARSLGSGNAGSQTTVAGHVIAMDDATLSEAEISAFAAATWLYETQWQAASSQIAHVAGVPIAAGMRLRTRHSALHWTIHSGAGLAACNGVWSVSPTCNGASAASAVAVAAEFVRVLQQRSWCAGQDSLTISTTDAVPATRDPAAHSSGVSARAAAQAGAALGGALRTAVLEDSRLRAAMHDADVKDCIARVAADLQQQCSTASRAGAAYMPR